MWDSRGRRLFFCKDWRFHLQLINLHRHLTDRLVGFLTKVGEVFSTLCIIFSFSPYKFGIEINMFLTNICIHFKLWWTCLSKWWCRHPLSPRSLKLEIGQNLLYKKETESLMGELFIYLKNTLPFLFHIFIGGLASGKMYGPIKVVTFFSFPRLW